ncbi:ABC-transporter extracellular N-terminal-domain-containing protein [Aspergillus undulatus]|uniref:ABC-transporter extracellular N-terminal-domain-containing protein n=1 Tax=Aspergillus undulatus TaxID=1810928 RepID=UPI003CCD33D2
MARGISFFSNRHGWALDNIKSFEVVLADGKIVQASSSSHPDLYKALRGRCSNFGIVTDLELFVYPYEGMWGGSMGYTWEHGDALIDAFIKYGKDNVHMASIAGESFTGRNPSDYPFVSNGSNTPDIAEVADQEDFDAQVNSDLQDFARRLSTQSTNVEGHSMFSSPNEKLDPSDPGFDPRVWLKTLKESFIRPSGGASLRTAGMAFANLSVHGYGSDTDYQRTVGSSVLRLLLAVKDMVLSRTNRVDILHNMNGVLRSGETLAVLGPPGSGCSTFPRTITGETYGLCIGSEAYITYQGIRPREMHKYFRGEALYTAEVDHHIPNALLLNAFACIGGNIYPLFLAQGC